jgi:hypothetical protein
MTANGEVEGRPEAPIKRRGRTLSSRARGAEPHAVHGPLQRLLAVQAPQGHQEQRKPSDHPHIPHQHSKPKTMPSGSHVWRFRDSRRRPKEPNERQTCASESTPKAAGLFWMPEESTRPTVRLPQGSMLLMLDPNQPIEQDKRVQQHGDKRNQSEADEVWHGTPVRLTVKLRGRPEALHELRGRTLSSCARGADTQAVHGPLQTMVRRHSRVP